MSCLCVDHYSIYWSKKLWQVPVGNDTNVFTSRLWIFKTKKEKEKKDLPIYGKWQQANNEFNAVNGILDPTLAQTEE